MLAAVRSSTHLALAKDSLLSRPVQPPIRRPHRGNAGKSAGCINSYACVAAWRPASDTHDIPLTTPASKKLRRLNRSIDHGSVFRRPRALVKYTS